MTAKRAHKEMQVKRFLLKGHLRYKTIIFENVSSETQVENFFVLEESYAITFSRY